MISLASYLDELRATVNAALVGLFDRSTAPRIVVDAMEYAVVGGGKRLRPCLALATAEAVAERDGDSLETARARALPNACALELVHTYSLVHDDLPAMDDDTRRRGRPTAHVIFGDGLAILAGDGLLTEAFRVIATVPSPVGPAGLPAMSLGARLRSVELLAAAAGAAGMVGGQAIDLAAAGRVARHPAQRLDATSLEDMHARKTGALIRAAATMGAAASDADDRTMQAVDAYARDLGLAFQIVDDVLDVEGSDADLGKTSGKDAAAHKTTYPALYGVAESRRRAGECIARAQVALRDASLGGRLADIAIWSLGRRQ